ncbi:hypothetical protein PWF83_00980 [Pantoea dispersa]|uniref:hypothetical protein n=1 Tax=Pantoea dispersa TaxID=59814 RepID=UPI0023A9DFAD|nr:hypothetical protein [Pantoea dispersa]WEA06029.1 hypothetical protein PWF83_00980 [Pantoea dispersa]
MRDKSRRYGLCDWTVQRSHPQMARLIVQISLPCDAAYNRTGGSGAIYCAFRRGAVIEMRDESRRYGLCGGIMQISHPQ